MSTVCDTGAVDMIFIEDRKLILIVDDVLEWDRTGRDEHQNMLVNKVSNYFGFIGSGQVYEHSDREKFDSIVIRVLNEHPVSRYGLMLLEKIRAKAEELGFCSFEWSSNEGDGFDDFVFDINKVYPRLKKNLAKDPTKEVKLMNYSAPDGKLNAPMYSFLDSYVYFFMQDEGKGYMYLDYDMIPEGIDAQELSDKAFENLTRDVQYRMSKSKYEGIYGILAGGDFEAESLCLDGLWKSCAEELGGDLVITVPTKDLVFFTRADDTKKVKEMLKVARENLDRNMTESPELIFSTDVFFCRRDTGIPEITDKFGKV